jgi:hypothetical protein
MARESAAPCVALTPAAGSAPASPSSPAAAPAASEQSAPDQPGAQLSHFQPATCVDAQAQAPSLREQAPLAALRAASQPQLFSQAAPQRPATQVLQSAPVKPVAHVHAPVSGWQALEPVASHAQGEQTMSDVAVAAAVFYVQGAQPLVTGSQRAFAVAEHATAY